MTSIWLLQSIEENVSGDRPNKKEIKTQDITLHRLLSLSSQSSSTSNKEKKSSWIFNRIATLWNRAASVTKSLQYSLCFEAFCLKTAFWWVILSWVQVGVYTYVHVHLCLIKSQIHSALLLAAFPRWWPKEA